MLFDDPIVSEVRAAGRKLEEKYGGDPKLFMEMLRTDEEKLQKEGWKLVNINDIVKIDDCKDATR